MEWQYISSKNNPLIVRLAKLKDKKHRRAEGLFRFDGIKLFLEAASAGAPIEYVLVAESAGERFCHAVDEQSIDAKRYLIADDAFARLTDESSPEGIVTVCSSLENITVGLEGGSLADKIAQGSILILESVRDAGNLGTIIRSAGAFGIESLVISSDCADLYNPKTVRGAMGALFRQRIAVVDSVAELAAQLRARGTRVFAAALERDARRLGSFELKSTDAIIIGNEGHGLSREAIDACDECLFIPMETASESLNASIAASVCMWELYRAK